MYFILILNTKLIGFKVSPAQEVLLIPKDKSIKPTTCYDFPDRIFNDKDKGGFSVSGWCGTCDPLAKINSKLEIRPILRS